MLAEIWGLWMACKRDVNLKPLVVEVDDLMVRNLVNCNIDVTPSYNAIVNDCRSLLRSLEVREVDHIYREGNNCADFMAKSDQDMNVIAEIFVFDEPPHDVCNIFST